MRELATGHATDVGLLRDHNEDNYAVRPDLGLWIVADGMGGHEAGEVASVVAIESVCADVAAGIDLATAIARAHDAVLQAARDGRGAAGMGCTVVALEVHAQDFRICWVGDSRGYLWDGEVLQMLTRDHSYVQQLIDAGALSEEEARHHPQSSVINQALGVADKGGVTVDSVTGRLRPGAQIFLCSDGLTGEVDDRQIASLLASGGDEQERVERLVAAANANGGSDNTTVVLVSAPDAVETVARKGGTVPIDVAAVNRQIGKKNTIWLILIPLLVFAVLLGGFFLLSSNEDTSPNGSGGAVPISVPETRESQGGPPAHSVPEKVPADMDSGGVPSSASAPLPVKDSTQSVPESELSGALQSE